MVMHLFLQEKSFCTGYSRIETVCTVACRTRVAWCGRSLEILESQGNMTWLAFPLITDQESFLALKPLYNTHCATFFKFCNQFSLHGWFFLNIFSFLLFFSSVVDCFLCVFLLFSFYCFVCELLVFFIFSYFLYFFCVLIIVFFFSIHLFLVF